MTDTDIGRMAWGLRDNAEDLFKIWMFQPDRRVDFGEREMTDIKNTVIGLNAIIRQHEKQRALKVVSNG